MKKRLIVALALVLAVCFLCTPVLADSSDREIRVTKVEMSMSSMRMYVNQTRHLWALVSPYSADDHTLYWESSNPEVAEVHGDGVVVAISPGTAVITARSHNNKYDTCTVTVSGSVLQGIQEDVSSNSSLNSASTGSGEIITASAIRSDVEEAVRAANGGTATVTLYDKSTVSTTALRSAAYTAQAAGGTAVLKIITPQGYSDGATYLFTPQEQWPAQGWITIDPTLASDEDYNIGLRVVTDSTSNAGLTNQVSPKISGTFWVVNLSHAGSFDMVVDVAANLQIPAGTSGLHLYSYDTASGLFTPLSDQSYTIDQNGALHFRTTQGGAVVITAQPIG